ncbi:hypothetical protein ACFRQM_43475 [Streptomyces sp. NPDC056831]|uniref:hypothetical protein n=1 Tax=Streptomyces sp. NPDC056831 TaxID=3345954 RepID=UPI00368267C0
MPQTSAKAVIAGSATTGSGRRTRSVTVATGTRGGVMVIVMTHLHLIGTRRRASVRRDHCPALLTEPGRQTAVR